MTENKYTFWIESPGELLNENFTDLLNMAGHSADSMAEKIDVKDIGEVYAYRIPRHTLITFVSKSDNAADFRVFVRQGNGEVRQYYNYHKRIGNLSRQISRQAMSEAITRASELPKSKK